MSCNDAQLHELLTGSENSRAYRRAAAHVESCSRCQQRLLELSSDHPIVLEACAALRESGGRASRDTGPQSSVLVVFDSLLGDSKLGASGHDEAAEMESESVPLDFLEPAPHPEMLGRLGRYDIERVIGVGGMGIVLKGYDTELHRVAAIKVLLPHLAHSGAARRRFSREAQAAAAIAHEHVIPIYNVETEGQPPYIVMQYVPGQSLQARVDEHGPLDIPEVLRIARQAAAGLAAAHAQGVIHRDIKPANMLLEDGVDRVLLSDFGLARTVDDASLTRTGVVAGTPHYMSPEQASGEDIDQRTDLYSLGSVLYFMCTGRPPFRANSAMAILNRICHEPHRPVESIAPNVPAELAEIIDRLLAKKRIDRYRTATDVEKDLADLLARVQRGTVRLRRSRWKRLSTMQRVLLVGVLAVTVIGAALMWQDPRTTGFQPVPQAIAGVPSKQVTPDSQSQSLENLNTLPSNEPSEPIPPPSILPPNDMAEQTTAAQADAAADRELDAELQALSRLLDAPEPPPIIPMYPATDWEFEQMRREIERLEYFPD